MFQKTGVDNTTASVWLWQHSHLDASHTYQLCSWNAHRQTCQTSHCLMPCIPCYLFGGKGSMHWWRWSWKSINWPSLTPFAQLVAFKFLLILGRPHGSCHDDQLCRLQQKVCLDSLWLHYLYQMLVLHCGFDSSKRTFITLLSSAVKKSKAALICPQTSLKAAKTLHTYPIWMWEAIKGGLKPQPWHHSIIYTQQWPRIANIWPSLASETV